jgi:hypothetical protein
MYLGGQPVWDEAILLVREGTTPPEAMLFLAAQFKAAIEPDALAQTLNDMAREAVAKRLRIASTETEYVLKALPEGVTTHRWVVNAVGGAFPARDIAALLRLRVQVKHLTLPVSVDEFDLVADYLIRAFADLL